MDSNARTTTTTTATMMTRPEVERHTRLSCSSIYRLTGSGLFPPPVEYPGGAVRWFRTEDDDWLASRPRTGSRGADEEGNA